MNIFKQELLLLWDVTCPKCNSEILNKNGKYRNRQRFICCDCGFSFTTYSKSLLDSTKLSPKQWEIIIQGVIDNISLKTISDNAQVSIISISKIRRNILNSLYSLNRFKRTLQKYYYDPFDKSTIFYDNPEKNLLYYLKYQDDTYITIIDFHNHSYISNSYSVEEFDSLMKCSNYPNIDCIPYSEIDDPKALKYFDNLLYFLKHYRGIKSELLHTYCNFYDFKSHLNTEELTKVILKQISNYRN